MAEEQDKKVLIVDDDADLREVLKDKITAAGFNVITAKDGKEGLETALKEHPALILLDIIMPVMDGKEMLKTLRADDWGKDAQVVMLTNVEDMEAVSEAVGGGSFDYIVKTDWDLDSVVARVEDHLRR